MTSSPESRDSVQRAVFDVRARGELPRLHALWAGRSKPVDLVRQVLTWSSNTLRCDFFEGTARVPTASLLARRGSAPVLLWHAMKQFGAVPDAWRRAISPTALAVDFGDSSFGPTRIEHLWFALAKPRGHVTATVETLPDLPPPWGLDTWWALVLPGAAFSKELVRGLPVAVRLAGSDGSAVDLILQLITSSQADLGWNAVPKAYSGLDAARRRPELDRSRNDERRERWAKAQVASANERPLRSADWVYSAMPHEVLKVQFPGGYIESWLETVRLATGYLGEFTGNNFRFHTANWPQQVMTNAPWPVTDQSRSVLPMALTRAGLLSLSAEIDTLSLPAFNGDLDAAIAAIADAARRRSWQEFIRLCTVQGLRPALDAFVLTNPVTALASLGGGAADLLGFLGALDPIVQDLGASPREIRQNQLAVLAWVWLGRQLPEISVAPDLPSQVNRADEIVYYSTANHDITIELRVAEIDLTINIDLFDWEHSFDLGQRPVLRPFVFRDAALLRALGQAIPALASLADIRFGYESGVDLARLTLGLDIDIQPELTVGSFLGGLLCPPCIASLFAAGSASAEITDAHWPLLVAASQDEFGLDAPALRAFLAEPMFGDVDASIALFSLNPAILLAVDVIGNLLADVVLEGVLQSMTGTIQQEIDKKVRKIPLPSPRSIATFGSAAGASAAAHTLRSRNRDGDYLVEFAEIGRATDGPLIYPADGVATQFDVAVLMAEPFLAGALYVPRASSAPFQTLKADGTFGDIDWWSEAPDLTGMPARPPITQQTPPPVSFLPQNAGQTYWSYSTVISVEKVAHEWRPLVDAAPLEPIGDVVIEVMVHAERTRYETVLYEDCEDVTRVAAGFMPEGPRIGTTRPTGGRPRAGGWIARHAARVARGGDGQIPGSRDGLDYGYFTPEETPLPDEEAPPQVPPVMVCRTLVTLAIVEREVWLEARLRLSFPIRLGWATTFAWPRVSESGISFLPPFEFQFVDRNFSDADLDFTLAAQPPLETLLLPANQSWLRALMLDRARVTLRRGSRLDPPTPGPSRLHHRFGDDLIGLSPEQLRIGFEYEVVRHNTFAGARQTRNLAIELALRDPLRGRL